MEITKLGIVGAGRRGSEIARIAAQCGINVILVESKKENLEKGVEKIKRSVDDQIKREKISEEDRESLMGKIQLSLDLLALSDAEFIIETITEEEQLKIELIKQLDELLPEKIIISSDSVAVSVTKLARRTRFPNRVVGTHFVLPIREMNLVEVIRGVQTGPEALQNAQGLAGQMGMKSIVSNDFPGCLANRILALMINEAIYALYEGVGTAEDIDKAIQVGSDEPIGPLKMADVVGLDHILLILQSLHKELGDSKYSPCPLLVKYVEAGYCGIKSGKGFYEYDM